MLLLPNFFYCSMWPVAVRGGGRGKAILPPGAKKGSAVRRTKEICSERLSKGLQLYKTPKSILISPVF